MDEPAFPRPAGETDHCENDGQIGMSLRDYFAARAMQPPSEPPMSATVLSLHEGQEAALILADGRTATVSIVSIDGDKARLAFDGHLCDVLIRRGESTAPVMDAEILALHDAVNILRFREQHMAAAQVFNVIAELAGGGATGRDGIRSRDPVDREQAKRDGIASRVGSRELVKAACTGV